MKIKTSDIKDTTKSYSVGNVEMLKKSLLLIGQVKPLHVRPKEEYYEIIDGRMLFRALQELHIEECECVIHDVNDDKALLIGLLLNLTHGERDFIVISNLLKRIELKQNIYQYLPYSKQECDDLLKICTYDWTKFTTAEEAPLQHDLFTQTEEPIPFSLAAEPAKESPKEEEQSNQASMF